MDCHLRKNAFVIFQAILFCSLLVLELSSYKLFNKKWSCPVINFLVKKKKKKFLYYITSVVCIMSHPILTCAFVACINSLGLIGYLMKQHCKIIISAADTDSFIKNLWNENLCKKI